jgi:hypothetical protein
MIPRLVDDLQTAGVERLIDDLREFLVAGENRA